MLAALLLLLLASGYNLTIQIDGYDRPAHLNLTSSNFTFSGEVENGTILKIPPGFYNLELYALNKTFVKSVNVEEDTTVRFNLLFTNSTGNISEFHHLIVYPIKGSFRVSEVVVLENKGDKNFEGDVTFPLPEYDSFSIESSSLSFIETKLDGRSVTFKDLLIAANGGGQILMMYSLKSNVLELKYPRNVSFVLLTTANLINKSSTLSFAGVKSSSKGEYNVYKGSGKYFYLELEGEYEIFIDPAFLLILLTLGCSIFFLFYKRSGGWKFQ